MSSAVSSHPPIYPATGFAIAAAGAAVCTGMDLQAKKSFAAGMKGAATAIFGFSAAMMFQVAGIEKSSEISETAKSTSVAVSDIQATIISNYETMVATDRTTIENVLTLLQNQQYLNSMLMEQIQADQAASSTVVCYENTCSAPEVIIQPSMCPEEGCSAPQILFDGQDETAEAETSERSEKENTQPAETPNEGEFIPLFPVAPTNDETFAPVIMTSSPQAFRFG